MVFLHVERTKPVAMYPRIHH